jgi:hypothetical protein
MMPATTSVVPNEVVRLEVLRLTQPLRERGTATPESAPRAELENSTCHIEKEDDNPAYFFARRFETTWKAPERLSRAGVVWGRVA